MTRIDLLKWVATVVQLVGYGLTGLGRQLWKVCAFFAGIALWFGVGVLWKDRAIRVVHVGAFLSLLVGYESAN